MRNTARGFTLIELLIVMAIIIVLAGLILATANYVQKKGYRSRAEVEIGAMSAALENYKADNGVYPRPIRKLLRILNGQSVSAYWNRWIQSNLRSLEH